MVISPNEVHLWCAYDENIITPSLLLEYHKLLNQEEIKQHKRFHFPRHQHQYLITRVLVRTVLSKYIPEVSPTDLVFKKNEYGKPYLDNPTLHFPLEFNISHSEKMVILAVTNGVKVGVDVEYMLRNNNITSIADRYFSPSEARELNSLELERRHERFVDLWTLKEAYIKAKGQGLSIPLDKFIFCFKEQNISISFDGEYIADNPDVWQFWQIQPNDLHKISLATTAENAKKNYLSLEIREITPLLETKIVDYPVVRSG